MNVYRSFFILKQLTLRCHNGMLMFTEHGVPVTSILKPNSLQNTLKYVVQQMIKKHHTNESQSKLVVPGRTKKRERSRRTQPGLYSLHQWNTIWCMINLASIRYKLIWLLNYRCGDGVQWQRRCSLHWNLFFGTMILLKLLCGFILFFTSNQNEKKHPHTHLRPHGLYVTWSLGKAVVQLQRDEKQRAAF